MHFVYILQSEKTGKYYVGQTEDVQARLARHNAAAHQRQKRADRGD